MTKSYGLDGFPLKCGLVHTYSDIFENGDFFHRFRKNTRPHENAKTLGTLSKDVFEPRTSTGSEAFSLFICLDANKLVLLSFFSLLKTIYPRVSTKPFPSDGKSPLPVDVRRSKTLLLKLPASLQGHALNQEWYYRVELGSLRFRPIKPAFSKILLFWCPIRRLRAEGAWNKRVDKALTVATSALHSFHVVFH